MTRGRRDWLDLQRIKRPSAATCRSPGAQRRLDPGGVPSASHLARTALRPVMASKNLLFQKALPAKPVTLASCIAVLSFSLWLGSPEACDDDGNVTSLCFNRNQ